jgi:two-component system, response regulator YesN
MNCIINIYEYNYIINELYCERFVNKRINWTTLLYERSLENADSSGLYDNESLLMNSLKLGDMEGVSKTLGTMFEQLKNMPVDYIQSICVEMVCIASRNAQDLSENLYSIVGMRSVIFESIYKKENASDLQSYMSTLFVNAAHYFSRKYNQKNTKVINRMKEIIEQRYREDISVIKISETGKTITEYITMIRMEEAKTLLKSTNLKILEVAEKVGYENSHYFSTIFKKNTGIHPQKYRS